MTKYGSPNVGASWALVQISVYDYLDKYREDPNIRLIPNSENKRMVTIMIKKNMVNNIQREHSTLASFF